MISQPPLKRKKTCCFFGSKIWLTSFSEKVVFFPHDLPRDFIQHPTSGCWPWGASGAPDPSEENKALWQWVISLRRGELGVGRGPGPWKVLNTWKTTLTYKCIWKRRSPTYFSPNVWDVGKKFALAKKTKIAHSPTGYVCSFRFFWLEFEYQHRIGTERIVFFDLNFNWYGNFPEKSAANLFDRYSCGRTPQTKQGAVMTLLVEHILGGSWRIIPGQVHVSGENNHGDRFSPLRIGLWEPF